MNFKKPRLALFGMDIFGEHSGLGIPVLKDLFHRLSAEYEITFYPFQVGHSSAALRKIPGRLRYFGIFLRFGWDHFLNPYHLIFSISVYPTGLWAVRAGRIFKCPVLVQLIALEAVALPDIGCGNLTRPWLKRITEQVCWKTDSLVVVAEYQKTIAIENLATKREMTVLPLRIDCRNFPYRSRNIISPVQFIQIGFYGPVKDQDTMFEAFAKVSEEIDCRLVVIGAGFNIPKAYDLVNKLRIAEKVTFAGIVSQAELPRFFSRAHILLHTARFETGCAVVQEAMASGVAVCGTNVGLLADIGEDYAVIVPPQNPTLLANEILKLVYDNARYEFITANAFRWITQYDASWAAENYHRFIKRFISEER